MSVIARQYLIIQIREKFVYFKMKMGVGRGRRVRSIYTPIAISLRIHKKTDIVVYNSNLKLRIFGFMFKNYTLK